MNRRIEISWINPQPGKQIEGTVYILEGKEVASMKVIAVFGIEYEISSHRFFRIDGKYLPNLSKKSRGLIAVMCESYLRGINRQSKIYAWEEVNKEV